MNYPIPSSPQEIVALRHQPIDDELVAAAIAGVIHLARSKGQSVEELAAEVMADDSLLAYDVRQQLSRVVYDAWKVVP